jgi:hypothetical protein
LIVSLLSLAVSGNGGRSSASFTPRPSACQSRRRGSRPTAGFRGLQAATPTSQPTARRGLAPKSEPTAAGSNPTHPTSQRIIAWCVTHPHSWPPNAPSRRIPFSRPARGEILRSGGRRLMTP